MLCLRVVPCEKFILHHVLTTVVCLCIILEVLTGVKRTYAVFYLCGIGLCKSMHSYDAIIDLADRGTSKQDKPMLPKYMLNQCGDYVDVKLI